MTERHSVQLYSVSQLSDHIRTTLERDVQLRDLWVSGEVSNTFASAAGHVYFVLKDANATVKAVHFSGNVGREHLVNGAQVNAHGRVSYYTVRGETQLYVDAVMPAGLGALAAEFERLRAFLEAEGLFDPTRKRPLPAFPERVGVVTSEHGAVIHDIFNVIGARYPLAEIVLCPATVQGDGAPEDIAGGIRALNAIGGIDVIIVGRGGGSLEDLWAFNTELVARAIHGSHAPVVSAVGHESDYTIADFVADLRAPTPSAAAAAVTPDARALRRYVLDLAAQSSRAMTTLVSQRARDIEAVVAQMRHYLPDTVTQRQRVDDVLGRGRTALATLLQAKRAGAAAQEAALLALNPTAVLERGFSIITSPATGATIASVAHAHKGDIVRATVRDGSFDAEVQ